MSTVYYFEIRRKGKKMIRYIVFPVAFSLVLFGLCMAADAFFPDWNKMYMKWPDMVKDFLCLKPWSGDLWLNIWQLFALLYPFYLIYVMMTELSEALSEEERLETMVYLHNAGIDRKMVFVTKLLVWTVETLVCCLVLMLVHVGLAALLRQEQGVKNGFVYFTVLFLVVMLYLTLAAFMAACKAKKGVAADLVMLVLILPWLVSRIPAFLRFFSELLVLTGREGVLVERIGTFGERAEVLTILSPLTWSWPAMEIPGSYIICGIILSVVMLGTAFSIYTHKKMTGV